MAIENTIKCHEKHLKSGTQINTYKNACICATDRTETLGNRLFVRCLHQYHLSALWHKYTMPKATLIKQLDLEDQPSKQSMDHNMKLQPTAMQHSYGKSQKNQMVPSLLLGLSCLTHNLILSISKSKLLVKLDCGKVHIPDFHPLYSHNIQDSSPAGAAEALTLVDTVVYFASHLKHWYILTVVKCIFL